jgi:hypothetical protein
MSAFHAVLASYGGAAATTAEYAGSGSTNPGSAFSGPRTISAVAIGTADAARYVVAALLFQVSGNTGSSPTTGVTIGGVTATKIGTSARSNNANDHVAEFWIAAVPTGTTADVIVSFTGSLFRMAVSCFKVLGYSSVFANSAVGEASAISVSTTINGRANGCILACATNNGSNTYTWTNLTERADATYGNTYTAASDNFATAQTGLTVTATQSSNNAPHCLSVVSL